MARILIIEDDPLVARMYEKALKFAKFDVEVTENGQAGIEAAKKIKPDMIYCDIMMPRMNGIEVLKCLKADQETAGIPVVMLTNLSGTQDADTALTSGATEYLVKSEFKPDDIAKKAEEIIAKLSQQPKSSQGTTQAPVQNQNPDLVQKEDIKVNKQINEATTQQSSVKQKS